MRKKNYEMGVIIIIFFFLGLWRIFGGFNSIFGNIKHLLTSSSDGHSCSLCDGLCHLPFKNGLFGLWSRIFDMLHIVIFNLCLDISRITHICFIDDRLKCNFSTITTDTIDNRFKCIISFIYIFMAIDC